MKRRTLSGATFLLLAAVLLLSLGAVACGGPAGEEAGPSRVEGPALVMFYTDN